MCSHGNTAVPRLHGRHWCLWAVVLLVSLRVLQHIRRVDAASLVHGEALDEFKNLSHTNTHLFQPRHRTPSFPPHTIKPLLSLLSLRPSSSHHQILANDLTLSKASFRINKILIPYSTMQRWCMDDDLYQWKTHKKRGMKGVPHWKVEKEVRARKELSRPGPDPILGSAETFLMLLFAAGAKGGFPYLLEDVGDILLDTLMEQKIINQMTGKPYNSSSNITTLTCNFLARCEAKGVPLVPKLGEKLSFARAKGADVFVLEKYRDETIEPALAEFQKKHGPLTLLDICNWDEAQLDLTDFGDGLVLVLDCYAAHVLVPFEQSPHITVVTGFAGNKHLVTMMIKIGTDEHAPNPEHCQLLAGEGVVLSQV